LKDKYEKQIDRLMAIEGEKEFKRDVLNDWAIGKPLFQFLTPSGKWINSECLNHNDRSTGCPVMIRMGCDEAWTDELTDMVRDNELIPARQDSIKQDREVLEEFARIQRHADATLERVG